MYCTHLLIFDVFGYNEWVGVFRGVPRDESLILLPPNSPTTFRPQTPTMGVCLSCTDTSIPSEEVEELPIQQEPYSYIVVKQTPTITPQTPSERGLSKIVSQRLSKRRASIAAQLPPVETTPLLSNTDAAETNGCSGTNGCSETREVVPLTPEYFEAFPEAKVESFYRHSREMSSRQAKNLFWLRSYWETVSMSLKPGPLIPEERDSFLSLRSIYDIFKSETPLDILSYLSGLAGDHEILKQVDNQYLLPLL